MYFQLSDLVHLKSVAQEERECLGWTYVPLDPSYCASKFLYTLYCTQIVKRLGLGLGMGLGIENRESKQSQC